MGVSHMGVRFRIRFVNDTSRDGEVCLLRDAPIPGSPPSAWLVAPVPGHGSRDFSWEEGSDRRSGYWIAFGRFEVGKVIDVGGVFPPPTEVVFPFGVNAVTATLGPDDTWAVEPTR